MGRSRKQYKPYLFDKATRIVDKAEIPGASCPVHLVYFDNTYDALDQVDQYYSQLKKIDSVGLLEKSRGGGGRGSKNWAHFKEIMNDGQFFQTEERVEELEQYMGLAKKEELVWDTQGAIADVGLFMMGEPECMIDFQEEETRGEYVTLIVEAGEHGHIGTEMCYNRGVLVQAAVEKLESQGVRCRVIYQVDFDFGGANSSEAMYLVQLKNFRDPFNPIILNFLHPSMQRRCIWAMYDISQSFYDNGWYGGRMAPRLEERMPWIREVCDIDDGETVIQIESMTRDASLADICGREDWKEAVEYIDGWIQQVDSVRSN